MSASGQGWPGALVPASTPPHTPHLSPLSAPLLTPLATAAPRGEEGDGAHQAPSYPHLGEPRAALHPPVTQPTPRSPEAYPVPSSSSIVSNPLGQSPLPPLWCAA